MQTLTFLNSPLLWGVALAAIPLIIHLLFRRRFRKIDWAPMRYLKLSIQRNRRRIRLEQLLLLLMRMAVIAILFFLVARPVMHAEGLGSWLVGRSRTSHVLVLDDSLSMGYRERGQSAFQRAQNLAIDLLKVVGPRDRFTLVLTSKPTMPLVREIEFTNPDEVTKLIQDLTPSDCLNSWETTLEAVDELVSSGTFPLSEITILTDLRRAGWEKDLSKITSDWAARGSVRFRVFDVGSDRTDNLRIASLEQVDRLALVGSPVRWEAEVRNDTPNESVEIEGHFAVDGKPSLVRIPPIAASETARVPLVATFQAPGLHHVAFQLPDDDLAGDNHQWAVCVAHENVDIVLVDGDPSSEPLGGEVDFLALALALGAGEADSFSAEVVTDDDLMAVAARKPDLLVLANVTTVSAQQAEALERAVKSGTGLMIFLGDQVDTDDYNLHLFNDGQGLLPASLETIADEEITGLLVDDSSRGPLDAMLQLNPAVLERIKIRRLFQVRPDQNSETSRVLARWNNAAGAPAVLEKVFGEGRVLLWTITADKAWSDWPTEPSYVLAVREAAKAIVRTDRNERRVIAGESLRRAVSAISEITSPEIEAPDLEKPLSLSVKIEVASETQPEGTKTLVFDDTRRAGLYKMTWHDSRSGPSTDQYAANPDLRESELARMSSDELRQIWGPVEIEIVAAGDGDETPIAVRGREIWRNLAFGLLGLAVFEAAFAAWTGRPR